MRVLISVAFVLSASLVMAAPAMAAVPSTAVLEGVLTSSGGGAAADGTYTVTFGVHSAEKDGTLLWTETAKVESTAGRFHHTLGSVNPISVAKLAAEAKNWLSLKVGADPEMPRQPIHSTLYSLTAGALSCSGCVGATHLANGSIGPTKMGFAWAQAADNIKGGAAADLKCSGCVSVSELKFDTDVDLGAFSLKAKTIVGNFVGDGSKLTGIAKVVGECKVKGEVVKGIKADGTLNCVAALDPTALPADGIDEISNGLIHNQFQDVANGKGMPIKDNNPVGISAELDFPDIGLAQKFDVHIDLTNSDLKTVEVTLFDPTNAKYLLYSKSKSGTSLKAKYPTVDKPVSGDLTSWINKNPKGKWRLQIVDTGFLNNGTDGALNSWSIEIQTLSNKKIQIKGNLIVAGTLDVTGLTSLKDLNVTGKITGNFPGGTTYTRWGRKTCPTGHELQYYGFLGGTRHNAKAGPSNYLCMHHTPQYHSGAPTSGSGYVYSGEYQQQPQGVNVNNMEVPCAVCVAPSATSNYLVAGRYDCPSTAKLAYMGYIWGSHDGHAAGDYICVDKVPVGYDGNNSNHDGNLPYRVNYAGGRDPTGKYKGGWQLSCAICVR